jgi:hypothetical protein
VKLFRRREEPPAAALAQLPGDERVVSWADVTGGVVIASPSGLWWPTSSEHAGDQLRLIPWPHITKAIWRDGRLGVIEADVVDDLLLVDRDPVWVEVRVPRDLPPTVRKRVEANVVQSQVHPVLGGAARFVARRVPGEDGVRWWARLEDGTPDLPEVRASVVERIAVLSSEHEARPD